MERFRINKCWDKTIVLTHWANFGVELPTYSFLRLNSAMTKDLIKLEMRCRVLSFRPTMKSLFVLHFGNYLHKASSREKIVKF